MERQPPMPELESYVSEGAVWIVAGAWWVVSRDGELVVVPRVPLPIPWPAPCCN